MDKVILTAEEAIYSRFGVPIDYFKESSKKHIEHIKLQTKEFEEQLKSIGKLDIGISTKDLKDIIKILK